MAVLVTGVGYIGAKLVERLLERGEEVVAIDNFFSTDARAVSNFCKHPAFKLVKGSITNPRALQSAFTTARISTVYSLAAQSSAHPEAAADRYTENTNLLGPRLLLDATRQFGVPKLIFASSFKVYGQELPPIVTEDTPYGAFGDLSHLSKCYVEKLMEMYSERHNLTCLAIRLGIVHGLSPVMKKDYRFMTAPNKFCLQAVQGETIELHNGADRQAGFIHVDDAAEIMIKAAESDLSGYVLPSKTTRRRQGYAPINAVTEIRSVIYVADCVAVEAKRRGLSFDIRLPKDIADASLNYDVVVQSSLDSFFNKPRRTIKDSVGEVIDYFRK